MKYLLILLAALFPLVGNMANAFAQGPSRDKVDYPEVPRVSAYEAYVKYKAGKAIIVQAGGEDYRKRHIIGAINMGPEAGAKRAKLLPNFPKSGIEIFTYCY